MDDSGPPQIFDSALVRLRRARALSRGLPDFLHRRAAADLADRFAAVLRAFERTVVFGGAPGGLAEALGTSGRAGEVCSADSVAGSGTAIVAQEDALPLAPESIGCFVSLFGLEQVNDLPGALVQIRRSLRPDGLFLAALLGGETLHELREAWAAAEGDALGGASPRVAPFADVRSLGALLQRAGFALPVVDADRVEAGYRDALSLMREVKALGWSNALAERSRRPVTRHLLAQAAAEYAVRFSRPDGRVRATFEIAYLTGWAPHESQQKPLRPGSAAARLADALGTVERRLPRE